MTARSWKVYLLRCSDNTLYCGICIDLRRRLKQHNGQIAGGAKYTAWRRPVCLLGFFECETKSCALKMEYKIKSMSRKAKLDFFSGGTDARD